MIDEVIVCTHTLTPTHAQTEDTSKQVLKLFPCSSWSVLPLSEKLHGLRLWELNTHTRTGLFICLPFRILLRIIAINRFALMRLSDAENCQSKHCTIYWEIRWRFSEGGHNNAEEVSDEFSILENSQNVSPMSGKFIWGLTTSDIDKVVVSVAVVSETSVSFIKV